MFNALSFVKTKKSTIYPSSKRTNEIYLYCILQPTVIGSIYNTHTKVDELHKVPLQFDSTHLSIIDFGKFKYVTDPKSSAVISGSEVRWLYGKSIVSLLLRYK